MCHKNNFLTIVAICFFFVFFAAGSFAQEENYNCTPNALSDVICDRDNLGGGGLESLTISSPGVSASGDPFNLLSNFGTGSSAKDTIINTFMTLLKPFFADLPPILQNLILEKLAQLLRGEDITSDDLEGFLATFVVVKALFDTEFEELPCNEGAYDDSLLQYAQNLYVHKISQVESDSLIEAILLVTVLKDETISEICDQYGGGEGGTGAPPDGLGGGNDQAGSVTDPNASGPGASEAPPSVTDSGDWKLATSTYVNRQHYAKPGQCALGVRLILEDVLGLPDYGLARCGGPHGHDYYKNLQCLPEWQFMSGMTPEIAQPGCVLTFDSNLRKGKAVNKDDKSGRRYGHVEIVTTNSEGKRFYTSDKPRTNWGGSVPQNYQGAFCCPTCNFNP